MKTEIVPYAGWANNLRFANEKAELIVSLDIGPRILSYRTTEGENLLKNFPEQLGQAGEDAWMIRGGHRLWIAPEDELLSYHWDNEPVNHTELEDGSIVISSLQREPYEIRKDLQIRMDENSSRVEIWHTATNEGDEPLEIATWGLTVLNTDGLAIIPQPPLGEHPRDLLPNRTLVVWPYSDLGDPRLTFGQRFITLQQQPETLPFKLGLAHRESWIAYLWGDSLFIKTFDHVEGAAYPDGGCNFETFTNSDMIEIESLGPLTVLQPGESVSHRESWFIFPLTEEVEITSEEALAEWITPFLHQIV